MGGGDARRNQGGLAGTGKRRPADRRSQEHPQVVDARCAGVGVQHGHSGQG
jgi:hypothetical protein